MSPLALPDVDLDVTVLEDLEFDHTPKCDNDKCERDATHLIRCHCQNGVEYICSECAVDLKSQAMANPFAAVIIFDKVKSCGHVAPVIGCSIVPL